MRKYFTLIELLIVIAVIAVLTALLLPALARAKGAARAMHCLSNVRQISQMTLAYTDSYNGFFPFTVNKGYSIDYARRLQWEYPTANQNAIKEVFTCPELGKKDPGGYVDYGYNWYSLAAFGTATSEPSWAANIRKFKTPSRVIIVTDAQNITSLPNKEAGYYITNRPWHSGQWFYYGKVSYRHHKRASCSFVDGHASSHGLDALGNSAENIWGPQGP